VNSTELADEKTEKIVGQMFKFKIDAKGAGI